MSADSSFGRGTLHAQLAAVTARARRSGALRSIPTACETVEQGGMTFTVRRVTNVVRKEPSAGAPGNPFLPYDPELFVADVSPTHVALLNKFNVLDEHLLIVTRAFEDQTAPLTAADFDALARCLTEVDGLAFYNSGRIAGASQPHRHLQLVPFPLAPGVVGAPLAAAFERPTSPRLPFVHAWTRLSSREPDAQELFATYRALQRSLQAADTPYNLLVTRDWMLVVPRGREEFESISINALGFAGAFFARDARQLERIRAVGPLAVLGHVGLAPESAGQPAPEEPQSDPGQ